MISRSFLSLSHLRAGLSPARSIPDIYNGCKVLAAPHQSHINSTCISYRNMSQQPTTGLREDAVNIFMAAVDSVLPQNLVKNNLKLNGDTLYVADRAHGVERGVHVVAFGKAVMGMVRAVEDVLGEKIIDGIASVPTGMTKTLERLQKWELLPSPSCRVRIQEGAENNIPDHNAFNTACSIKKLLDTMQESDFVLTLISGGGSALLPYPVSPLTLGDIAMVTKLLSKKGATIQQLNTVRKDLEVLKGEGLIRAAFPARMATLILSDVIGDDLDIIASGPTVPKVVPPSHSLNLIQQFDLEDQMPRSILEVLKTSQVDLKVNSFPHDYVQNLIVGSNRIALDAAWKSAKEFGYIPIILTSSLSGFIEDAVQLFVKLLKFIIYLMCGRKPVGGLDSSWNSAQQELELVGMGIAKQSINELRSAIQISHHSGRPLCLLAGGETTVNVKGQGLGGRNQEMALLLASELNSLKERQQMDYSPVFLSAGTDGQDGPTDAAGAVVDGHTLSMATNQGLQPHAYLDNNDSYNFFKALDNGSQHVISGFTGTNVMDLQIMLLKPNCIHELL